MVAKCSHLRIDNLVSIMLSIRKCCSTNSWLLLLHQFAATAIFYFYSRQNLEQLLIIRNTETETDGQKINFESNGEVMW